MNIQSFCRQATPKELSFYDSELYPLQDRVFEIASVYEDRIYLTGGTALSRFHYQHRLSEDLDFFTTTDDLRLIATDLAARLRQAEFNIEIERIDPYFSRFFILKDTYRLKIEFVKEYNLYGNLIKTEQGIYINNLEDMGANKISAFEDRAEIKDIIDLYYITHTLSLERLFELAEIKRVPVAYERLLTINAQGISGLAMMRQDLDMQSVSRFLDNLKQRTETEIKKKQK